MTKRLLKVIGLSEDGESKTLKVRFGEHDYQVGLQRIELESFGTRWLVSAEDVNAIFGNSKKSYYAALVSELANEKYVSSGVALDLDELDNFVASGRRFKEGIPSV